MVVDVSLSISTTTTTPYPICPPMLTDGNKVRGSQGHATVALAVLAVKIFYKVVEQVLAKNEPLDPTRLVKSLSVRKGEYYI